MSAVPLWMYPQAGDVITAEAARDATEATAQREAEARRLVKPVLVSLARGQSIIEPGERVSPGPA